ncbi:hypothetical protein Back11_34490 [Paenibacillus baekrokdamisoli]|uniref:Uncharacterized protein n=1 Tax=Paenibacillus baekrokdamisoli TaxID=1712516 RepID=A0A3G9JG27_9BACL|nr:hypothetical protein [Paenibacillus baekrokdamisoli]MBB3070957.1 hypothetical protein [Paenibacillus baekrokdamisoli]BBH22104.1 hypothetical protein Back11_34490 [Paenibacillus baekrokdamisoli]
MNNLALFENKDLWFRHPIIGDASFDTFERYAQNPVHKGSVPFEWPVNGTLFKDPISQHLYIYATLYYKGYWPPRGVDKGLHCIAYKSTDNGVTWTDIGTVLEGSKEGYVSIDGFVGGVADMCVNYDNGVYHAIFGWADPDNINGGLGYARSDTPDGPFVITDTPLHAELNQPLLLNRYKRIYSSSLIKRENDWIIIAMMSTPGNWGGTWALVVLHADKPEGPYGPPQFLVYPQSKVFHPPIVEFFPAFQDQDYVYCPFTSVALNRNFQVIYRALKEKADLPEAWEIYKYGSVWHAVDAENESQGIWGQAFAGIIDNGDFKVMYPAKTAVAEDCGTINLAQCRWDQLDKGEGFYLSAPNGSAVTFLQRHYEEFVIEAEVIAKGKKALFWAHGAPIGPNITTAAATLHPLMLNEMIILEWEHSRWQLKEITNLGETRIWASGDYAEAVLGEDTVQVSCTLTETNITINNKQVWNGIIPVRAGRIGLLAEKGNNLFVRRMTIDRAGEMCWLPYLATEGLIGAGEASMVADADINQWKLLKNNLFRFGFGYKTSEPGSIVKWNYVGADFKLWSPRGPELGKFNLYLDGQLLQTIDLTHSIDVESSIIYESTPLAGGYHAVTLEQLEGNLVCDSLDFLTI